MAHSPQLRAILDKSRQEIKEGGGIGHEQFWAEVETENESREVARQEGNRLD